MSNILLCVDDSVTMQTVAEITFRKSDWEYVGARNSDEAKSSASAKSPSVILVDAVLSEGSGYGLASELKAASPGAVVIMMCGNSEVYVTATSSNLGKPTRSSSKLLKLRMQVHLLPLKLRSQQRRRLQLQSQNPSMLVHHGRQLSWECLRWKCLQASLCPQAWRPSSPP